MSWGPLMQKHRARTRLRDKVVSALLASEADKHPAVVEFRQRVLQGRLLNVEEMDAWMVRQRNADGPPTQWLTQVPVPEGYDVIEKGRDQGYITKPPLQISERNPARGTALEWIAYGAEGLLSRGLLSSPQLAISANGVLDSLRGLSVELHEMFGWSVREATDYVLTGEIPQVRPVRVIGPEDGYITGRVRIALEIDLTLTPRQVSEYYRGIRKSLLGGHRVRTLSEKHLRLAEFIGQRQAGEKWSARLEAWNQEYPPEWKYEDTQQFRRDCKVAGKRLRESLLNFTTELTAAPTLSQPEPLAKLKELYREAPAKADKELARLLAGLKPPEQTGLLKAVNTFLREHADKLEAETEVLKGLKRALTKAGQGRARRVRRGR